MNNILFVRKTMLWILCDCIYFNNDEDVSLRFTMYTTTTSVRSKEVVLRLFLFYVNYTVWVTAAIGRGDKLSRDRITNEQFFVQRLLSKNFMNVYSDPRYGIQMPWLSSRSAITLSQYPIVSRRSRRVRRQLYRHDLTKKKSATFTVKTAKQMTWARDKEKKNA